MKVAVFASFLTWFAGSAMCAATSGAPVLTKAPVKKIFVPQGMTENESLEVIIYGEFPNGCYTPGPTSAELNFDQKQVVISAESYFHPGTVCTLKVELFTKTLKLKDQIPAGTYAVIVKDQPQVIPAELVVGQRVDAPSEGLMFASVKSADVLKTPDGETQVLLEGSHPYLLFGCLEFDTIQATLTPENVLDVQPLTKIVDDAECEDPDRTNKFVEAVVISESMPRGEYLLHVKTLGGGSINKMIRLE